MKKKMNDNIKGNNIITIAVAGGIQTHLRTSVASSTIKLLISIFGLQAVTMVPNCLAGKKNIY